MVITREELLEAEHEADVSTETDPSKVIKNRTLQLQMHPLKNDEVRKEENQVSFMAKTICTHIHCRFACCDF